LKKHREAIVKLYDAGIRWMDTQVAHLADTLRQLGLWQDCVIAVTADHGEEFLDHGGRYHPPSRVTEELVRVPLLLHGPGVPQVEVAEPFSLMHLAPTLLDLVDIPIPGNFRGRSHAGLLKNNGPRQTDAIVECISGCTNPFVAENRLHGRVLAVREARYKMVMDFNSTEEKLFDLRADPGELRPIPTEEQKPVRRRLLERARQHLSDSLRSRDDDYRMAARLRDLRLEWTNPVTPASI
jgi:arylsulfatase A-like enzyme